MAFYLIVFISFPAKQHDKMEDKFQIITQNPNLKFMLYFLFKALPNYFGQISSTLSKYFKKESLCSDLPL